MAYPVGAQPTRVEGAFAKAQDFVNRGEWTSAVIALPNILKDDPGNVTAMVLLGLSYLEVKEYAKADKLFDRAIAAGLDPMDVAVGKIRSLYHQKDYDRVLLFFDPANRKLSDQDRVSIYLYQGRAFKAKGERDKAKEAFQQALSVHPGATEALEELASLAVVDRDLGNAQDYINAVLAGAPNSAKAWELQGTVYHLRRQFDASVRAYKKALEYDPDAYTPLLWGGWSLVALGKLDEAEELVDKAHQQAPQDPVANYLRGVIAFQRKDYRLAEEALGGVLFILPADIRSKLLLAAVYYRKGEYLKASMYLQDVVKGYPGLIPAYSLYGRTMIAQGRSRAVLQELAGVLEQAPKDISLRLVLIHAAIDSGQLMTAVTYLEGFDPGTLDSALAGGIKEVSKHLEDGWRDRATQRIQQLLDRRPVIAARVMNADPGLGDRPIGRIAAQVKMMLRRGHYDQALTVIMDELTPAMPGKALPSVYTGMVQAAKGRIDAARVSYARALALEPNNVLALLNLGKLDESVGDFKAAEAYYQQALNLKPKSIPVLLELAQLSFRQGQESNGVQWLQQAIEFHPVSLLPRMTLAEHYLRQRDGEKAKEAIWPIYRLRPKNVRVLDVLGRAELLGEHYPAAAAIYGEMVSLLPKLPYGYVQLGGAQLKTGKIQDAEKAFQTAWELEPGNQKVGLTLAQTRLLLRKFDAALDVAKAIDIADPDSPLGPALMADVAMVQRRYGTAVKAYNTALARRATAPLVRQLTWALVGNGAGNAALKPLQDWLSTHPDDSESRETLARAALELGDTKQARRIYQEVIQRQPDNQAARLALERLDRGKANK
jgi:tetratricopeptide (TPR) repeat protein